MIFSTPRFNLFLSFETVSKQNPNSLRQRRTKKLAVFNEQKKYNSLFVFRILISSSMMALKFFMLQLWLILSIVFVSQSLSIPTSSSDQNIETFYPNETSVPSPAQQPSPPTRSQQQPSPPRENQAQGPVAATTSSSSNGKIAKAVAGTAASTIVVCGLIFLLVQRCLRARRRKEITNNTTSSGGVGRVEPQGNAFERVEGNVKGFIVDEDGLDVIYWRKLEGKDSNMDLHKEVMNSPKNKEKEKEEESEEDDDDDHHHEGKQVKKSKSIQEIPLLRGKSSGSHLNLPPEEDEPYGIKRIPLSASSSSASVGVAIKAVQKPDSPTTPSTPPPPASPSTPSNSFSAVPKVSNSAPFPPPMPERKTPAAPPPPPPQFTARKSPAPPPPPPSSSKSPSGPIEMPVIKEGNSSGKGLQETNNDQVKLKPLHWDKVNTNNADHSMVWDKVDRGSFRVDQDLMEALFGYVATNRRSPKGKNRSSIEIRDASAPSAKTFLLEPRKSQNIAIVLKSLAVSPRDIVAALMDGKGLNADTLEKLARVSPTEEEKSLILEYKGDPARLAAAESFLYNLLKAVPSAFKRLNAMLFRLNYDSEIQEIKETLQAIEQGCKELRSQGLFVKLLEAVLKAGNRMNAGTARGNAQAFNLASLRKLSDVKSTNGKTTLLHFVVEEVVRSEGKRAALNRSGSLSRSSSSSSNGNYENNAISNEQMEREYLTLGLPIVGGISSEFSNVKKAANVDYNNFVGSISSLSTRLAEIRRLVSLFGSGEGGNFVKEMDHFVANAEEELKSVKEKQASVLQLVKKTSQYYQGGASKDTAEDNLQLFAIVKDFLGMVDQTCIEIARDMQKRKIPKANY